MKVKNNKHQKMMMMKRKRKKNVSKLDPPRFTDKEIDEFRKKNGLPRLSKPKKVKNKSTNDTNMKNNVRVMFKENDDYGETEEIKVSFDSVNLKKKSKNKSDIFQQKSTTEKLKENNKQTNNKTYQGNAALTHINSEIINKDKIKDPAKSDNNLFHIEKKIKKQSKKRNRSNEKNSQNNDIKNTSENNTDSILNTKQVSQNAIASKSVVLPEPDGIIDKLQQRIMQRYKQKQNLDQKEDTNVTTKKNGIVLQTETLKKVSINQNSHKSITDNKDRELIKKPSLQGVKKDKKKDKLKKILEKAASSLKPNNNSSNNLRDRMMEKLKAAQFRYLNERLYTSTGSEAQQMFTSDPEAFTTYHQGYRIQVSKWPLNPLDVIVKKILKMPKSHIIADMGCGEATLSTRVPQTVHSLDLVSASPQVTACDMAHTPLQTQSVDVAVYCLSLMGTQLNKYLKEANRVLKIGGRLLIAEVESRFDDVNAFTRDVDRLGFKLKHLDQQHQVFFFIDFEKVRDAPAKMNKLPEITLKPCLYKKR